VDHSSWARGILVPTLTREVQRVGWDRSDSQWRNSIGLTSLLIVAVEWLWFALVLVPAAFRYHPLDQHPMLNNLTEYYELLLPFYMYPAVLFAMAFKGEPRFQALGASLLYGAALHPLVITE